MFLMQGLPLWLASMWVGRMLFTLELLSAAHGQQPSGHRWQPYGAGTGIWHTAGARHATQLQAERPSGAFH